MLFLLISITTTGCIAEVHHPNDALMRSIDALSEPYIADKQIVGMSMGIIRGNTTTTHHFGLTEANGSVPNDSTHYEIGSITKTMTGLLLADGVIRGCYKLDTPVSELVPEAARLDDRVTLQSLSVHTSGLPRLPANLFPLDPTGPYAKYDEAQLFAWLTQPNIAYEPGTKAMYSNLAAGLLGYALARHADTDFESLLQKRILAPLAMDDTSVDLAKNSLAAMAKPHREGGTPDHPWDMNVLVGAGGVRSNITDMMKYLSAQLYPEDTPLRDTIKLSQRRQIKPGSPSLKAGTYMGLGWLIEEDGPQLSHHGQTGGYYAAIWLHPDKQVGFVVLSNTSSPQVAKFFSQIQQAIEKSATAHSE